MSNHSFQEDTKVIRAFLIASRDQCKAGLSFKEVCHAVPLEIHDPRCHRPPAEQVAGQTEG